MPGDPRFYLAAERTFLAWIRTGLAMMGLGFVIARFGLFLREFQNAQPNIPIKNYGLSFWFGTGLILLGAAINAVSAVNHVQTVRKIHVGVGMAIYLVSVR
jgi:putative membrane protein